MGTNWFKPKTLNFSVFKTVNLSKINIYVSFLATSFGFGANPGGNFTHSCDEAVEGLSPFRVLDCDWTEIVSEPDGRDDPARVAVGNIFLCEMREGERNLIMCFGLFYIVTDRINQH